jgi:hypothetical protein
MKAIKAVPILLVYATLVSGDPKPPKIEKQTFTVSLTNGLGTATSKEKDQVTATVLEPQEYLGWDMIGEIGKLKPAKRGGHGAAELEFHMDKLVKETTIIPVQADLIGMTNSKGVKDVDEEGNVIGRTSGKKKAGGAILGGVLGAGVGYATGGAAGAGVGAAAGALGGYFLVKMTTKSGDDIRFEKGSHLTLQVSSKGK